MARGQGLSPGRQLDGFPWKNHDLIVNELNPNRVGAMRLPWIVIGQRKNISAKESWLDF